MYLDSKSQSLVKSKVFASKWRNSNEKRKVAISSTGKVKFSFSKKATKISRNLPVDLNFAQGTSNQLKDFIQFCGLLRNAELQVSSTGKATKICRNLLMEHQINQKVSFNFVAFLEKLNCSYLQQEKDHHEGNCNLIIVSQPRKLSLSTDKQRLTTIKIVGYHLS